MSESKNHEEIKKMIDESLVSGDNMKLASILKGLSKESDWLKSNEGLEKLIKTLDEEENHLKK